MAIRETSIPVLPRMTLSAIYILPAPGASFNPRGARMAKPAVAEALFTKLRRSITVNFSGNPAAFQKIKYLLKGYPKYIKNASRNKYPLN
jgi:hypothetical protein